MLVSNSRTAKRIGDKTMERKIGETFEYEGKKLQVKAASNDKCEGCIFNGKCTHFTKEFTGICGRLFREDKKNIIIVEVTDEQSQEQAELFEKAKCDYVSYKRNIQRLEEKYPSLKYLDCSKYPD